VEQQADVLIGATALCTENLLHLSDLALDYSGYLFCLAFGFQVGIVGYLSRLLLYCSFHVVKLTFYFISCTGLH
jgi:hypothetical protein